MNNDRSRTKLLLAVLLLAVAGGVFIYMNQEDDGMGEAAGETSDWYCTACQKPFQLTTAELSEKMRPEMRDASGDGGGTEEPQARGRGDRMLVNVAKCPVCNEWKGEAARKCPECGELFRSRNSKGETAICPKCQWDPSTGHKARGERLNVGE
mgnify:CR=1 FL=1